MNKLINSNNDNEIKNTIKKITSGEIVIPNEDHSKVFLWACENGHLEIVKLLIATHGFDSLNTSDTDNKTPFFWACERGHLEIVKLLIETPGFNSLNTKNYCKSTPFLRACQNGHLEIVKLLIATPGFNSLNTPDIWKKTPFSKACYKGHLEIVKLLITTPGFNSLNTHNIYNETPFLWACYHGHLEIVKLLITTPGFDSLNIIDDTNKTPFYYACRNGNLEIIQILLLQDDLIRPNDITQFSKKVQNKIIDVDTNRMYYMKQYKTSLVIDIYRLVVFLSDDYLKIKSSNFFKIIKELPSELQIKIIFATVKRNQTYILTNDFNDGLKEFVRKIENL
jgi:ankyrin repeat protein